MKDEERQIIIDYLKGMGYSEITPMGKVPKYPKRYIQLVMKNKKGEYTYFSVMCLSKNSSSAYYDYTTLSEWLFALCHKDHFYFVLYRRDLANDTDKIKLLLPEQVVDYTSIPPFKIAINLKAEKLEETLPPSPELTKLYGHFSRDTFDTRKINLSDGRLQFLIEKYKSLFDNKQKKMS